MRLDHLLSKETSRRAEASSSNVLRSVQGLSSELNALFNLEGTDSMYLRSEKSIWANSSAG